MINNKNNVGPHYNSMVQSCPGYDKESNRHINVRVSLFFDGTGNNRYNANGAHGIPSVTAILLQSDESFRIDLSNIARLYDFVRCDPVSVFDYHRKIYITGVGTLNGLPDALLTEGTGGAGEDEGKMMSGLKVKVKAGISSLVEVVSKLNNPSRIIQKLRIDVFGFSRGAAAARHFIHVALFEKGETVKEGLKKQSNIRADNIEIYFVGLFDTVACYGLYDTSAKDDISQLNLESTKYAFSVVHLIAADEYRKNFPLSRVPTRTMRGPNTAVEFALPGAHSDIGGGYRKIEEEDKTSEEEDEAKTYWIVLDLNCALETDRNHSQVIRQINKDKTWLIDHGWYLPSQLHGPDCWNRLSAQRNKFNNGSIPNVYDRIPLHIMGKWISTESDGLTISGSMKTHLPVPKGDLLELSYELGDLGLGVWDDWLYQSPDNPDNLRKINLLKRVRNKYLHFSSHYSDYLAMRPRFSENNAILREREIEMPLENIGRAVPEIPRPRKVPKASGARKLP